MQTLVCAAVSIRTRRDRLQRFGFVLLLALVWGLVGAGVARSHDANGPLRFGVFPYLPPLTLDEVFQPVVADLSSALGRQVQLRTKDTFFHFREELSAGSYDLVFVHPFFYTYAADTAGYEPIARLDQDLIAVLLARPDAGLDELKKLEGRVLGLPDRLSAVSMVLKAALLDHGLRPGHDVELRHFRSKQSCLHAAAVGTVDACGVPRFLIAQFDVKEDLGLQAIYEAPPINHFVLAAHPGLAQVDCLRVRDRVLAWKRSAKHRLMMAARGWQGFVPASDSDYESARAIQVTVEASLPRH